MATTQQEIIVHGTEEVEETLKKKVRKILCFDLVSWVTENVQTIGRDVHIKTEHDLREIYINGEPINLQHMYKK